MGTLGCSRRWEQLVYLDVPISRKQRNTKHLSKKYRHKEEKDMASTNNPSNNNPTNVPNNPQTGSDLTNDAFDFVLAGFTGVSNNVADAKRSVENKIDDSKDKLVRKIDDSENKLVRMMNEIKDLVNSAPPFALKVVMAVFAIIGGIAGFFGARAVDMPAICVAITVVSTGVVGLFIPWIIKEFFLRRG